MATEILHTACPLDCPDACSLEVRVDAGRVIKLDGSRLNPITDGYICSKVRKFPQHVYGRHRLLEPAIRRGPKGSGTFEPISWDAAYDLMVERFRSTAAEFGGESILPFNYGGSNGLLTDKLLDSRLFRRLGASRIEHTVCAAAATRAAVALYGKMPGVGYEDYPEAKLIVIWGANPAHSGIHLVPQIREAVARGAKLVVIDPRRTKLAKQADLHLPLLPGTDLALALAVHNFLFENGLADQDFLGRHALGAEQLRQRAAAWPIEKAARVCGLEASEVERFARLYAETSPALVRSGWGIERNRNGGSATCAVLALPAVAGKFGVRGGGYTASNSGAWKFDAEPLINEAEPATRLVNMNRLGQVLLDPERSVRLLFVYNCNPLATMPRQDLVRQGLEREDLFTVVFEQVMTDSALYADLILPATTFLEHSDLRKAYGAYAVQPVRPVIAPCGESKSNLEVFAELIRRLDLERPGDLTSAAALEAAFLSQDTLDDRGRQAFAAEGLAEPLSGRRPIQFVDVFPKTVDRKAHLFSPELDQEAIGGLYVYKDHVTPTPLALISPASHRTISSYLGQLNESEASLTISPADARSRGIAEGDEIRIWNEFGEVRCRAEVSAEVREGVVSMPKGLWCHQTRNGSTSNVLCPDTYTDLGDGATFNDARVEVTRV